MKNTVKLIVISSLLSFACSGGSVSRSLDDTDGSLGGVENQQFAGSEELIKQKNEEVEAGGVEEGEGGNNSAGSENGGTDTFINPDDFEIKPEYIGLLNLIEDSNDGKLDGKIVDDQIRCWLYNAQYQHEHSEEYLTNIKHLAAFNYTIDNLYDREHFMIYFSINCIDIQGKNISTESLNTPNYFNLYTKNNENYSCGTINLNELTPNTYERCFLIDDKCDIRITKLTVTSCHKKK
jgi:hypothetical protein